MVLVEKGGKQSSQSGWKGGEHSRAAASWVRASAVTASGSDGGWGGRCSLQSFHLHREGGELGAKGLNGREKVGSRLPLDTRGFGRRSQVGWGRGVGIMRKRTERVRKG